MDEKLLLGTTDVLTPEQHEALRARRQGEKIEALIGADKDVIARAEKTLVLSPRQLKAQLRRKEQRSIALFHNALLRLLLPPQPRYFGPPVRWGLDVEWVTLPDGSGGWRNEVLCIVAVIRCGDRTTRYIFKPKGPRRADRPTMPAFFGNALRLAIKEGTVPSMPDRMIVFGHFIRGDISSFSDFWAHKREFRGLGKTVVSAASGHMLAVESVEAPVPSGLNGDDDPQEGEPRRPPPAVLRAPDGRRYRIGIRFVDTIKLTPGQKGLAYVADMHGTRKLDLHDDLGVPRTAADERPECVGQGLPARYGKDRMDLVWRDFPELMEQYAFRDSEIALDHGLWAEKLAKEQFGLRSLPSTISGFAKGLVRDLAGGAEALAAQLGKTTERKTRFNEKTRTFRTVKESVSSPGRQIFESFAADCYHGGRNECFYHGPTGVGTYYDFDLPGAYTTGLVILREVDYDNMRQVLDADAYGIDDAGIAWVIFEFPAGTRFPCLPVTTVDGALTFPLEGRREDRVYVGSPEIFLARQMGASVTIVQGFKAPWKSDRRLYEDFTRMVQSKRKQFPKEIHAALNAFWKEVGNSLYGQIAQGLANKGVFDPKTMGSQPIGPSPVTEPMHAAICTSFIRAVLGEILSRIPPSGTVISATTDGLLTDVPLDQLDLSGPLCSHFADIRERLFGAREVLDPKPKHGARQIISVAVRTTFTARRAEGLELVCAKGSVRPPTGTDPTHQSHHMVRLYWRQRFGMKVAHEQLISAREQFKRETDLYGIKRERTLNLRYDFKRKPVSPRMVALSRHSERIAWDTVPWQTVSEAEFARVRVDGWSRERERVFKAMEDYRDWESFFEASWSVSEACKAAGVKTLQVRRDNAAGILKRVFLQAGRQGQWGITFPARGLAAVAKRLTDVGFPTGKEDITYAKRRDTPLLEHCVPWVPETVALLHAILEQFPLFEYWQAFRPIAPADLAAHGIPPRDAAPT